ncbi:MAG: acyltransferase [Clostridiales bacterium]|nr:acyltransferase [Clostridiales bacterium]
MGRRSERHIPLSPQSRREGNIELLRIVSMLLIISHHLAYHGSAMNAPLEGNKILARFLFAGGQTGVNCFVLITGYFLTEYKTKRLLSIWLETLFYSLGLMLLAKWTGLGAPTDQQLMDASLVVLRSPYWFVVMYLGLTALLPFLAPAVKKMGRRPFQWVLGLGTAFLSIVPTLTLNRPSTSYYHLFTWFLYLYLLGAYFRRFPPRISKRPWLCGMIFFLMIAVMALSSLWGEKYPELFSKVASRHNFFADKNTMPQLICSCALFLWFAGMQVKATKALTLLSGASFGVYLMHDHVMIRSALWGKWLKIWPACQRSDFWLLALLAPLGIYMVCALVDLLRKNLLEGPLMRWLEKGCARIDQWLLKP